MAYNVYGRILWIEDGGTLLLGDDLGGLLRFDPGTRALEAVARPQLPGWRSVLGESRHLARLFRRSPRCVTVLPSGCFLWVAGRDLWRKTAAEDYAVSTFHFPPGHSTLFMAQDALGRVYWGEYVSGRESVPSSIYCSDDGGQTWREIFRFAASQVRHVHGVFWDEVTRRVWLTTGDGDDEAGLWMLENDRPVRVVGGASRYRIVQPIFTESHILFGTDTPGEPCGIYSLDRATGRVELLADVRGPIFYACRAGDWVAFSSVVEPTHTEDRSAVYVARLSSLAFVEAVCLRKDRWPKRLFQYGQIHLPQNSTDRVIFWLTPCATECDGRLIRFVPAEAEVSK